MICWIIIGLIFLSIEYLVLKNISIYYEGEFHKFLFKIWHLIILSILNIIPILNIICLGVFIMYIIMSITEEEIKINYNKDSELFKFLNKEI